jgi:hypothetical protein
MKDFKKLREEALRQQQRQQDFFQEGDFVMSALTGEKGTIKRVGGNYAIVISESGEMFRSWIRDIRHVNVTETINKGRKRSIFKNNGTSKTID